MITKKATYDKSKGYGAIANWKNNHCPKFHPGVEIGEPPLAENALNGPMNHCSPRPPSPNPPSSPSQPSPPSSPNSPNQFSPPSSHNQPSPSSPNQPSPPSSPNQARD